jgi:hypothetical protein
MLLAVLDAAAPATDSLPWLGVAGLLLLAACVAALSLIVARLRHMESRLERLDRLEDLKGTLDRIAGREDDLDVRRLEHVLIDIRDGQKRVEDRMLSVIETRASGGLAAGGALPVGNATALAERVVNRLLALGYERVQLVTPMEDVGRLAAGDGEIVVEARRDGATCKGRVSVRKGALTDVQMQSAYSAFP